MVKAACSAKNDYMFFQPDAIHEGPADRPGRRRLSICEMDCNSELECDSDSELECNSELECDSELQHDSELQCDSELECDSKLQHDRELQCDSEIRCDRRRMGSLQEEVFQVL